MREDMEKVEGGWGVMPIDLHTPSWTLVH